MKKLVSVQEAVQYIKDSDTVLAGGFGLCGSPLTIIDEMTRHHAKNLTVVSNNLGEEGRGLGKLLLSGHLKKAVGSFFTTNKDAVQAWSKGELNIELIPQGTLAEAIRAGGAGIGGFYTKTAVGTEMAVGKETKVIDGEVYLFQPAIKGDVAIVKATMADTLGNLYYEKTTMNFNPACATAGKITIAEVDRIVDVGEIHPDLIRTPHVYVDYVVLGQYIQKGGKYVERNDA